jgi:hypothetical protein
MTLRKVTGFPEYKYDDQWMDEEEALYLIRHILKSKNQATRPYDPNMIHTVLAKTAEIREGMLKNGRPGETLSSDPLYGRSN